MQFQVTFDHSIQRHGSFSYVSQSRNQSSVIVEARSSSQAADMVRAMYGGHQNCQIKSVYQRY